jgi:hypothetical protein
VAKAARARGADLLGLVVLGLLFGLLFLLRLLRGFVLLAHGAALLSRDGSGGRGFYNF